MKHKRIYISNGKSIHDLRGQKENLRWAVWHLWGKHSGESFNTGKFSREELYSLVITYIEHRKQLKRRWWEWRLIIRDYIAIRELEKIRMSLLR